ncbi:MAG: HpcH/HpaI aldolase/citrate lyase family protein [Gemmatimonadota bacterium]
MTDLKARLARGEATIGSWMTLGHSGIAEIMVDAGFDWLVVDLEHTAITIRETEDLIRTIELKGCVPLVRLTSNDPDQIKRVMDAGAHGVVVPMVRSATEAETAVRAVRYPPAGTRSVGLGRAQGYGPRFAEYAAKINTEAVVLVQIEHVDSLRNLEEILTVDGVDGSVIGPYDLSGSLGHPGVLDHPDLLSELRRYEEVSKRVGVPMGYHVVEPDHERVGEMLRRGYSFVAFSADFLFLGEGCRRELGEARRRMSEEASAAE